MSNDKVAATWHGTTCRWGGSQTLACWQMDACGCAVLGPTWLYRWQPDDWWYPETDVTIYDEDMPGELRP